MEKKLPARPNLDHLRRQAKTLLAELQLGAKSAAATFIEHLPAAKDMTAQQVQSADFRLADAQAAIARKSGFAGWPHLARHVERLRALEGTWAFERLEIDGRVLPAGAFAASQILIDGDRFRTESPDATYEGIFNINVEAEPHEIDIEFVEGPEAGIWNFGIFRLDGERLEICLDMNGKPRPSEFRTSPGSGRAYETLRRSSPARPENVTGGNPAVREKTTATCDASGFDYVESETLNKLQGQWKPVEIIRDGQELPSMMLGAGIRSATQNEVTISFGGRTMIHALVRLNEDTQPMHIDYYNLDGATKGSVQLGIFQWTGDQACFCMAAPDDPRPADFTSTAGSGRTFSQWHRG